MLGGFIAHTAEYHGLVVECKKENTVITICGGEQGCTKCGILVVGLAAKFRSGSQFLAGQLIGVHCNTKAANILLISHTEELREPICRLRGCFELSNQLI